MPSPVVLVLALATPPKYPLSPEAIEHNKEAMRLHDARQWAPAVDAFHAAYRSMPDARHALEGREQLLGSMRATLLEWYEQTREVAPLCRLRDVLQEHIEALTAAFPEDPDRPDLRSARARHTEVSHQLATYRPGVCDPPPLAPTPIAAAAPTPATTSVASTISPPTPAPVASTATPPPVRATAGRPAQIAGAVLLPIGLVALGVVGGVATNYRRDLDAADALHTALQQRPCTDDDRARMHDLLTATRRQEGTMIALGVVGGALISTGVALLVRGGLQRRGARLGLDLRPGRALLALTGEF